MFKQIAPFTCFFSTVHLGWNSFWNVNLFYSVSEAEDEIPVVYEQLCEIADPLPSPSQGNGLSANIIKSCTKLEHDSNLLKVESTIINDECMFSNIHLLQSIC